VAITPDAFWSSPRRHLAWGVRAVSILVVADELLYACVAMSPFWKPGACLEFARWLQQNMPPGTAVVMTPFTPVGTVPGSKVWDQPMVGYEELKQFPRRPVRGRGMVCLAAHRSLNRFKKHPPDRPINPQEWYYGKNPPTIEILRFYAELNKEQSDSYAQLKRFYAQPSFLGFDLRFFVQSAKKDSVYANRGITVFAPKGKPATR